MSARLYILIALAVVLAGIVVVRARLGGPSADQVEVEVATKDLADIRARQRTVWGQSVAGEEPPEPAALSIQVWVDPTDGKDRLHFAISEAHGYYVDSFSLVFWHRGENGATRPEDAPLTVPVYLNNYLKANETLHDCVDIVPAELIHVGGDIGTTEDWSARVLSYYRARLHNPDPLPVVERVISCN